MPLPGSSASLPAEFYDPEQTAPIAIRIDGPDNTRGAAQAFLAQQWDLEFTEAKVRRRAWRIDTDHTDDAKADGIPEPYDGWPLTECGLDDPRGHAYWTLDEECYDR